MNKILIADVIKASYDEFKDQRDLDILDLIEKFKISEEDASYLYDNFDKNRWEDVINTADELNVDITDIDQEDIDNVEEMGASGSIGSSMGDIEYEYDPDSDAYEVDISFNRGGSANYQLDSDALLEFDAGGGTYYNANIRGN
jgi:hypothetical protein